MNTIISDGRIMSPQHAEMVFQHRILIVEPNFEQPNSIYAKLSMYSNDNELSTRKVEVLASTQNLAARVAVMNADVLVLSLDSIDDDSLNELITIKQESALAVVIFASQYRPDMTKKVMSAGVSSYIVDDVASERLPVILDLAIERFNHLESMNKELVHAQQQLSDRKLIEKAKGILMRQKGISEDQAYKQIRSSAMNKGCTMGVLSQKIISVFELID